MQDARAERLINYACKLLEVSSGVWIALHTQPFYFDLFISAMSIADDWNETLKVSRIRKTC